MIAPYGQWPSPITVDMAAAASGGLTWPSGAGGRTWWCASDPQTATVALMRRDTDGSVAPVLGAGWSVRNRVNGYGGRPYAVRDDGLLAFTEDSDRRVYRFDGARPAPLTPSDDTARYADPIFHPDGGELWCIREITLAGKGDPAPRTSRQIVAVPLDGSAADAPDAIRVVASLQHFLSGIRISPDGRRLCWIGWDHPQMPWDATQLMVADLVDGVAVTAACVLGGADVSVPQAEWADNDTLYAMADPDGWWNLHRLDVSGGKVECVLPMPRECASALWRVGATWFALAGERVVLRHGIGAQQLALWDPASGALQDLAPGWNDFGTYVWADARDAVIVGGCEREQATVLRVPLTGADAIRCLPEPPAELAAWTSIPRRHTVQDVHFIYYPPTNPDYAAPVGALPPLLIYAHGGPTSHADATPSVEYSMFTSRGFAVVAVDYGGSTGYGRAYRERLRHSWGVVDVADCVTVAGELVRAGEVDGERIAIRGDSAGGWTTLACLASTDMFCAGAVYYPISDALQWSGEHTHDFESRYLESLIGSLPDDRDRFERVSPLRHADRITSPLVMLQGADDPICPPRHARAIIDAVSARGLWNRMHIFDGEGHGFRKASSVVASLRAEVELYSHAMNIDVADIG